MEQAGRVGDRVDGCGKSGGEGEVVGVAVCAVGAEGEDDVGTMVADVRGEEGVEVGGCDGVERAVGKVEEGRGTGAERRAGGVEFKGAGGGEGFGAAGDMVVTALATGGAEEIDSDARVGGEGQQPGKGVALVVGVGDNREQA